MSKKLIVMPTKKEIAELGKKIRPVASPSLRVSKPVTPDSLIGHTLMLNTAVTKKFQCGGFSLGPMRPFAVVTSDTQLGPVARALEEEKLVDITGTDKAKGLKNRHGSTSDITEEDTGRKVFVTTDAHGNMYVVTPKNKTEQKKFEREIKKTGTIKADYQVAETGTFSGLSSIVEEEISPIVDSSGKPIRKTPAKKATNVHRSDITKRSKRRTRR